MSDNQKRREDYEFRIRVENNVTEVYQEPIADFARLVLDQLLNHIVLTFNGKEVKVDGFYLNDDHEVIYNIFTNQ